MRFANKVKIPLVVFVSKRCFFCVVCYSYHKEKYKIVRFDEIFRIKQIKICCVSSLDKTGNMCYDIRELLWDFLKN